MLQASGMFGVEAEESDSPQSNLLAALGRSG
jgi:hypothetical protein